MVITLVTLIKKYGFCDFLLSNFRLIRLRVKFNRSFLDRRANFMLDNFDFLKIGENCNISAFTTIAVSNDSRNSLKNSYLEIGDRTYIGECNNIRAGGGRIIIGNDCLISQHITIVCSNHTIRKNSLIRLQKWSVKNNFVFIGSDVWIGANSIILPGSIIGNGAVIGAGSIINFEVPPYAIVKGYPATIVGYRIEKQ